MNARKKIYLLIIYLIFLMQVINAQKSLSDSVVFSVLQNAQLTLSSNNNYRFDIFYKYSNESTPSQVLDTLKGFLERDSSNYHFKLGNTEMVKNLKYSISLFNDDKILYLAKAQTDTTSINPLLQFNNLLKTFSSVKGYITTSKKDSILTISFPDSSLYKSIVFYIDKQTHIIDRVIYLIKTEALSENGTINEEDKNKYDKYARVEAIFSNFHINTKNQTDYFEADYIKRDGDRFTGVGKYINYKVIIGSPEL